MTRWARYSVAYDPDYASMVPGVEPVTEESEESGSRLPLEYLGIDRVLQRWAVSVSGGMQTELWEDSKVARPPPLDEPHALIVDQAVCRLKRREERFITYWYRKNVGIKQLKKKLHIRTSEDMYGELCDCLKILTTRIRACNSKSLVSLLDWKEEQT